MIIRFVGGPADKHIATIYGAARELTFPVQPPLNTPERERVAVYKLECRKTGNTYRYTETKDA